MQRPSPTASAMLEQLLGQLLRGRRQRGTATFTQMRHDRDLVPGVAARLQCLVGHTEVQKYVAADVQGPHDEGGDVVLRVTSDLSRRAEYFVFQIKAHDELGDSSLLETLAAQYVRAQDRYDPMIRYFILPFGLAESSRHDERGNPVIARSDRRAKVRAISSRFIKRTDVTVIEPPYLAAFWALNDTRFDAFVRAVLGEDDVIRKAASHELSDLTPSQVSILMEVACRAISSESPCGLSDMAAHPRYRYFARFWPYIYENGQFVLAYEPEYVQDFKEEGVEDGYAFSADGSDGEGGFLQDHLAADLDALSEVVDVSGDSLVYLPHAVPGLTALLADGLVRFSHRGGVLADYGLWILNADHVVDPEDP